MDSSKPEDERVASLRAHHALNPHPADVTDMAFMAGGDFFDPGDLVQVKYEMLRRVNQEGHTVIRAAASFGFSRPSFYQAQKTFQAEGLPGLLPQRPGPRRGHKLTPEVVGFLEQELAQEPSLSDQALAGRVHERFGFSVHHRSVQRSLARGQKKR